MKPSQLQHGLIPKGQQCPFAGDCAFKDDCPAAELDGHHSDYSCGMARAFDIFGIPKGVEIGDAIKQEEIK